ncbi:carboxylic ester hydrolase-like [Ostrinia nubilalis]|uniref:carboxylic ester hydrolase-like n=1 Tax=Ostrinia nubilalis TaxID=29057 RepID=UPI003082391B
MIAPWGALLVYATAFLRIEAQSTELRVDITQGPVIGYKVPDTDVFSFNGIPYATAPTGTDKFKAPLPPPTWTEPFEAKDNRITCPQQLFLDRNITEDCLIANIYVPDTEATNLPVLVAVHGGAFQIGYGDLDKPVSLVNTKRLIAVNFNYRLGAHGFLCLGTEDAPGNAGMKDQVALLRWVKTNIAAFGGNPDDVTVVGCSAGGASVDLLRLSSTTDDLMSKAMPASGGNAGSFGIQLDPVANAKFYASALGFENVEDIAALGEFYKTAPLLTLLSRPELISTRPDSNVIFAPCVEKDIGVERFLEDAPVNILNKGEHKSMPLLYGFAEKEGLIRLGNFEIWRYLMDSKFSDFLPADLEFSSEDEKEEVASRVREFYFGNQTINEGSILAYIDYFSDVLFAYSMLRSVRLNSKGNNNSPTYLYEYSFYDDNTPIIPHTNERGPDHCDQYTPIFDIDETDISQEYRDMIAVLRSMLIDFVTTGNPVSAGSVLPAWAHADATRAPHVNLGVNVTLRGPLNQERAELWDSIYDQHYRTPISPGNTASITRMVSSLWILYSVVIFTM